MNPPKVAVVGASCAGLVAAYRLARRSVSARVFEADRAFNPSERTLIVTPAILELMDFDFSVAIVNYVNRFRLNVGAKSREIFVSRPDIVLERHTLLKLLRRKAEAEGAEILLGCKIREVQSDRGSMRLICERDRELIEFEADYVIVANGVQGLQLYPPRRVSHHIVGISQVRVDLPGWVDERTVHVWFDTSTTRFFYWLIPEGRGSAVVGVIGKDKEEAKSLLASFLKGHGFRAKEWQDEEDVPLAGLGQAAVSDRGGRIFFAGDSAAQVKATTVGGLVTGLKGGISCADSILTGVPLTKLLKPLSRELVLHALARRVLDLFKDEDYERLVECVNSRLLSLLSTTTRDELTSMCFRLFLFQPKLLVLLLRALLRSIF